MRRSPPGDFVPGREGLWVPARLAPKQLTVGPAFFGGGQAPSFHLLLENGGSLLQENSSFILLESSTALPYLDGYTTNLWGAYSIDQLFSTYFGNALTAVNLSNSASAGIGFAGRSLDTTALATLSGGTATCVVSEFLNQFGAAGNKLVAAGSARPQVANAGVYSGKLVFDGIASVLNSAANSSGVNTAFTIILRGNYRAPSATNGILCELSANFNQNKGYAASWSSNVLSLGIHDDTTQTNTDYWTSNFNSASPANNIQAYRFDKTQPNSTLSSQLFVNGVLQTRNSNSDAGTVGNTPFGSFPHYVGARGAGTLFSTLDLHTVLIYEGVVSNADIASISSILAQLP